MATTVLGALTSVWAGDAALPTLFPPQTVGGSQLAAGLWMGQPPEGLSPPVAALVHNGERPEWTFESPYTETTEVSFVLFVEGLAALEAAVAAVKSAYDWIALPLAGVTTVEVQRTSLHIAADERSSDAGLVFRAQLDYRITIMRALAQ